MFLLITILGGSLHWCAGQGSKYLRVLTQYLDRSFIRVYPRSEYIVIVKYEDWILSNVDHYTGSEAAPCAGQGSEYISKYIRVYPKC